MIDYTDQIGELEDTEPKDKRKKEWKDWKEKINSLIKEVNKKAQFKMYKPIK